MMGASAGHEQPLSRTAGEGAERSEAGEGPLLQSRQSRRYGKYLSTNLQVLCGGRTLTRLAMLGTLSRDAGEGPLGANCAEAA
jgi:hypothetical protein